ncbi:UNVERIFIED_CONTAM: hypothetical protein GTU68_023822, partial [Idotea baltica]|nr:hypothetical protein [Idotea baltica]
MAAYEVEQKFPLRRSPEEFIAGLAEFNAKSNGTVVQEDIYFSHPGRDFRETDEALRIRSIGEQNIVTYKGPLLDETTKTRQEIEIPFDTGSHNAQQLWTMLRALGFRDVRHVRKTRQIFTAHFENREYKIAVDDVDELGRFVEVETLSDHSDWEQARDSLLKLAELLDL